MDVGCVTIVILAQTKTNAKTKNKQKGDIKMKAYKGFDRDLKCRGFQYEIGKEYEEKEAEACEKGFHACENPLEVFRYYPPCDGNRYCEVEQDGELSKHGGDSKVASTKIKIGVELGLKGLIQAGVSFILDKVNWKADAATNTGTQSAAVNSGYRSAATNTGDLSAAEVSNGDSVAIVTGYNSKAKAGFGSAIVITERGVWNGKTYPLINIKAAIVDGEKIKANTWYTLRNGEFVECD